DVTSAAPGCPVAVNGGPGSDVATGSNAVNYFFVTGPDKIDLSAVGAPVAFESVENILGASGTDRVVMQTGGSLSGWANGGGGSNSLDYSGDLADVVVNLLLGKATSIAGGISNIQNVAGGLGNNTLVGDANANVLSGGKGRNLLIGGAGADQL